MDNDGTRPVPGYEYHYGFSIDDELVSMYNCKLVPGETTKTTILVETRTSFTIKKLDGEDLITGSEKFVSELVHDGNDNVMISCMFFTVSYRLVEYWMTRDEIFRFELKTLDFVKQTGRLGSRIVPIVVNMEVRTVQQDGESLEAAMERAIKVENLFPVSLWPWLFRADEERDRRDDDLVIFLRMLKGKRKRVVDIDGGLAMMAVCRICSRGPTVGAQITKLPSCGHAFHSHCIVRWLLEDNKLCPTCHSIAFDPSMVAK